MSSAALESITQPIIEKLPELQIVRAGAGAGKTTDLVEHVLSIALHFINKNEKLPHFVVTTFTRKATQELKERLLQRALKDGNQKLIRFVQSPSHLHISTIHGVLSLYLFQYGSRIGLGPEFKIIDGLAEEKILKKKLKQLLKDDRYSDFFENILSEIDIHHLIDVFKSYFEYRFLQNRPLDFYNWESQIAALSDEVKSWTALAKKLYDQTQGIQDGKNWTEYLATLGSYINQLEKSNYQDLQPIIQFDELKLRVALKKGTDESIKELKTEVHDQAANLNQMSWLISPEFKEKHQQLSEQIVALSEDLFQETLKHKIEQSQLTMGDLENFSLLLTEKNPESAQLFSERWNFWFVDEYQDTSPRQVRLLKQLIGDRKSFTVGDPQQSIYLFRGARSEVFTQKEKDIISEGGIQRLKMENYRSEPALLQFFNDFFIQYDQEQFSPMTSGKEKLVQTQLQVAASSDLASPDNHLPSAYYIKTQKDEKDSEYLAAIQNIIELMNKGVKAESICILSRSNLVLQRLAKYCYRYDVPIQLHSGGQFRRRREIQDAILLLKFLVNPHDNPCFIGLTRSPWFRVSDQSLTDMILSNQPAGSYWVLAGKVLKDNPVILYLQKLMEQTNEIGLIQAWELGLRECGIFDFSYKIDPSGRREANLMKLLNDLRMSERQPGFRILDYIYSQEQMGGLSTESDVSADGDAIPVISPDRVNLMTVHASKGLQFDHVIVIGMGQKSPPVRSSVFMFDEEEKKFTLSLYHPESNKLSASFCGERILQKRKIREKKEASRVLYVALTRAKKAVYLVWQNEIKDSWAQRMWKPKLGLENYGKYTTSFQADVSPQIQNFSAQQLDNIELPEKLNIEELRKSANQSVTEILSSDYKDIKIHKSESANRIRHLQRGVDIHRIFELLKYQSDIESQFGFQELSAFLQSADGKLLQDWIQKGHVEWGFCVVHDDQWIQGQIDLWARIGPQKVVIVDYKTGTVDYLSKAKQQLNLYAWALRKMNKINSEDDVEIVVIYPLEGKIFKESADPAYSPDR